MNPLKLSKRSARVFMVGVVLVVLMVLSILSLQAQIPSRETYFTTSVVYQNVSTFNSGTNNLYYYQPPRTIATTTPTPTPVMVAMPTIAPFGSSSRYLGDLIYYAKAYRGSGRLETSRAMVSAVVQIPQNSTTVGAQPVSNGASTAISNYTDFMATTLHLPTVLSSFYGTSSIIAVQNVDTTPITITLSIYQNNGTPVTLGDIATRIKVPPGASVYYDLYAMSPGSFNTGSGKLVSTGKMAAIVTELHVLDYFAHSFEGIGSGATKIYLPSARCDYQNISTALAIRNTSTTTSTTVTVRFGTAYTATETIAANGKWSMNDCSGSNLNYNGTATIESSGSIPIVAVAKTARVERFQSSYTGIISGGRVLALPYVRWTQEHWGELKYRSRTFISIQNIGTSTISSGQIEVHYFDKDGDLVFTYTNPASVAAGSRFETNPYITTDPDAVEFGYYDDAIYGGSVIIEGPSGSILAAVARVDRNIDDIGKPNLVDATIVSEEYSAVPINLSAGDVP